MSYRLLPSSLLVLAGLGLAAGHAAAADLDPAYGIIPPLQQERVEFGSGWYVRGDLGVTRGLSARAGAEPYSTSAINSSVYANGSDYTAGVFSGPGTVAPGLVVSNSHTLTYDGTLGGGYQFNKWFRADVTFDFHQPSSSAYQGTGVPCITGTSGITDSAGIVSTENILSTTCTPTLKASLKTYSALFNGYVDLGTWSSVTPYVGAGIGMSFGHASASSTYYQNNTVGYANIAYKDAVSGTTFTQNWDRSQSVQFYNLAFALMGGIAIDVFDHTKLDIGYRYLHLGNVIGTNLNAQEVRAGLRYMIDN